MLPKNFPDDETLNGEKKGLKLNESGMCLRIDEDVVKLSSSILNFLAILIKNLLRAHKYSKRVIMRGNKKLLLFASPVERRDESS